jgi:hypothetical protein
MADADVPITAGTGTKIDTRTVGAGTDEHRQVVVVGDPTTAANVAAVSAAGAVKVDGSAVTQPVSLGAAVTIGAGASTIGTVLNVGDVDHDAVNTLKVVQTGGHASYPAAPTGVSADGDRVRQWQDRSGAQIIRKRPVAMYSAVYRLANATAAARPLSTGALTANTNKQIATIYHTATSTKRVQVKYVAVTLHSIGAVAGTIEFEIVTLSATTAPATGAPTITPAKNDQADAAAEAACLALPGTQGSVVNADQPLGDPYIASQGISGAGSTASPPPSPSKAVLWDSRDAGDGKDLIMRAGTAEGYAVIVRSNAASTVLAIATIFFTEE